MALVRLLSIWRMARFSQSSTKQNCSSSQTFCTHSRTASSGVLLWDMSQLLLRGLILKQKETFREGITQHHNQQLTEQVSSLGLGLSQLELSMLEPLAFEVVSAHRPLSFIHQTVGGRNLEQSQILIYRFSMFGIILTLAAICSTFPARMVVLDDSNYTSFTTSHPLVFLKFYSQSCIHCKAMAQDYRQLAQASATKDYVVAQVDVTNAQNTVARLRIQRYPTLIFSVNGVTIEYPGERTASAMQSWLERLIQSQIKPITEQQLQGLIRGQDFAVVVRGASKEQLQKLAITHKITQIPYFSIAGDKLAVTMYSRASKEEYLGEVNVKQISNWVLRKKIGNLVALSSEAVVRHTFQNDRQLPAFLLLKNPDLTPQAFQGLHSFCQMHEKYLKCGYVDQTHQLYAGVLRFLKTDDRQHSVLVYLDYGIKNGYKFNNTAITFESLIDFWQAVKSGSLYKFYDEQAYKAQKRPYRNVLQLSDSNFNSTLSNNQYVFVQYYSPYCQYCLQFAPHYEALATRLKQQNSSFVVAAADLTEEYAIRQQVYVNGYPTFRFYVQGQQLDYNGDRDVGSILSYMEAVAGSKLKTVAKKEEVPRPAVAIYGIKQDSPLRLLPFVFTRFPVYRVLEESTLRIQVLQKKFTTLSGEDDLRIVGNWLEEMTEPSVVNIFEEEYPKKLTRALEGYSPLLVLVNRDDSPAFQTGYKVFELFCDEKFEYVCGVANSANPQFSEFNQWLAVDGSNSALVYINTTTFDKFVYDGDLHKLSHGAMSKFISRVKAEKGQRNSQSGVVGEVELEHSSARQSHEGGLNEQL